MQDRIKRILTTGILMVLLSNINSIVTVGAEEVSDATEIAEAEEKSISVKRCEFTSEDIRSLQLVENGEEIFYISYEPDEYKMYFDYWEILNPYSESITVDTEIMYQLYNVIAGFDFTRTGENITTADAGLDTSSTYMIIKYIDETAGSQKDDIENSEYKTLKIFIGNMGEEGNYYISIEGEEEVYLLPTASVDSVFELNPFKYILKIPVLVNIEYLESVEVRTGEIVHIMEKNDDEYRLNGEDTEKEEFSEMYQALMNVFLVSEIEEMAEREKEEILRVVYHMKDGVPETEVVYYTWKDEEFCTVAVNGKEQFLVRAEEVEMLMEYLTTI